jgi:type IV pilus assembly protein PilC
MNEFTIKLADERGRVQEQIHAAATAEELRSRFTQAGYLVYSVKPRSALGRTGKKKIKLEPFLVFNQQLLTLIRAGLPIPSSLELLAKRQKDPGFRAQMEDVAARVKTGQSISEAFEAQGTVSLVYTTTLLAGERSGNLEEVLARFLEFQRVALTFRKKLRASLIYPAFLVVMVIGLFIFLITFVVPRFADLYSQLGTKLPTLTLLLLSLGQNAQHYGLYIAPVIALAIYLIVRWSRTDSGAATVDRIRIALPVLGSVWVKYQVGLFARTLATLLTGGLPPVPSLETAARSIESRQIARAVITSVERIREGQPLHSSLLQTGVFPELSIEMIEVGEASGALPQMLNSVAEFFEEDVQTSLAAIMSLIEPIILIAMGVVVVVVLIALYLPIFSLNGVGGQ